MVDAADIVFPDGSTLQDLLDGAGIWEDSGTLVDLTTARDVDMQSKRFYLKKGATDAASTYLEVDATSGNLIIHVASGEAVEWKIG